MRYAGDTGRIRNALLAAGVRKSYVDQLSIFNDLHRDGTRRIKLWNSSHVVFLPVGQQQQIANNLYEQFGERIISLYSRPRAANYGYPKGYNNHRDLCIELED